MTESPVTKWDLVNERERTELDAMPFGHPCSGCGEVLETEGHFARHFVLYNTMYRNLGYCPVKGPNPKYLNF